MNDVEQLIEKIEFILGYEEDLDFTHWLILLNLVQISVEKLKEQQEYIKQLEKTLQELNEVAILG